MPKAIRGGEPVGPGHAVVLGLAGLVASFVEFENNLICLHGKKPKLSDRQQLELCRMPATGEYSISDLSETLLRLKTNRLSRTQPVPVPLAYDPAPYRNRPGHKRHIVVQRTSLLELFRLESIREGTLDLDRGVSGAKGSLFKHRNPVRFLNSRPRNWRRRWSYSHKLRCGSWRHRGRRFLNSPQECWLE